VAQAAIIGCKTGAEHNGWSHALQGRVLLSLGHKNQALAAFHSAENLNRFELAAYQGQVIAMQIACWQKNSRNTS
jgi:predicted negative regulator of RcsB-dependent stress response